MSFFFFFNDTATTEIYTLSLHDALPICLDRSRGAEVDDRADVRPVDPHAERVGSHDDLERAGREVALHGVAGLAVEPGVIGAGAPAPRDQPLALLVRALARGRVHDRGAALAPPAPERLPQRAVDQPLPVAATPHPRGA